VITIGQDFSNKGKDFWITYPNHVDGLLSVMGVYITSNTNASGTITVGTQVIPFTVTANGVVEKFIGQGTGADASSTPVYMSLQEETKTGAAIHVVSDNPVVVYAHIIRSARSGATLLLPSTVWGREYIVPSYPGVGGGTNQGNGTLTIVAADTNTVVQITPTVASSNGLHAAGTPYTITLASPGDVYQVLFQKNADISGTLVQSVSTGSGCKKIAVFSSSNWTAFGCNTANSGDNLYQQLFPTGAWGKSFLTAPFKTRNADIIRVFIKTPGTVVTKLENGVSTTLNGLVSNSYYEFTTGNPVFIQANSPISVVQYATTQACQTGATIGDPEMVLINPIEQTINNITVFSAHQKWINAKFPGQSAITNCYLNIIIKSNSISSFTINGAPPTGGFVPIAGTSYSYLQEEVTNTTLTNPVQNLKADSNFIAIAYGFGAVESYGYNAGTNVIDLSQGLILQNQYATSNAQATCINTPSKLAVKFAYQPTSITWDFGNNANITPNAVAGPFNNPVADSSFVDNASGKTIYVYKLPVDYSFKVAGKYDFVISSNNPTSDGCSGVQQQTYSINVVDAVSAKFVLSSSGCISDSLHFTDSSNGNGRVVNKWVWDFKDGTNSTLQNPAKKYAAGGSYNVTLRAINDLGCFTDTSMVVNISANPVVKFINSNPACATGAVNFNDQSTIASGTIVSWKWNYGNGKADTLTTNAQVSNVYAAAGNYSVKLQLQTNTGCTVIDSSNITIHSKPTADLITPDVCLADAFAQFTDSSYFADGTTGALTYAWNFGDANSTPANNISALQSPKHKYNSQGSYTVLLTVTSSNGCTDQRSKSFTVNGSIPVANFDFTNTNKICSNQKVEIKNSSTVDFGSVTRIEIYWDLTNAPTVFDIDESPAQGKLYSHNYPVFYAPASKTFQVKMRSFSGGSCVHEIVKAVTLYSMPKLSFGNLSAICNDAAPIQINNATETASNAGSFIFAGSGVSNSGLLTPKNILPGADTITYTYTTINGCIDSIKSVIAILASPKAIWSYKDPTCEKTAIIISDSSKGAVAITSWQWNFGNGQTAIKTNAQSFTQTFSSTGNYNTALLVTDANGCKSDSNIKTIVVHPLPLVNFTVPVSVCLPAGTAAFTDQSSIADNTQSLFSYAWNFDDAASTANTSVMKDPVHNYSTTGIKNIVLTVTSKDGCAASTTKQLVNIYPQPKAKMNIASVDFCVNQSIAFSDNSSSANGNIASYNWTLGNGTLNTQQQFSYAYNSTGNFTVQHFITDDKGCISDTVKQLVQVNGYPTANAGIDLFVLEGGSVQLKPTVSGNITSHLWVPGTYLNSDTALMAISTPAADIEYTLEVTGKGTCVTTDKVLVTVLKTPRIPNVFTPNGDGINDLWVIEHLNTYPDCTVEIYDSYGLVVFRSKGYNKPWDGTRNGSPLMLGTYYYIVDPKNGRAKMTGYITILR
jgi:gliding motility-associated-like protein